MAAEFSDVDVEVCEVSGAQDGLCSPRALHRLADAAHRVRAMLHAAEALTEKHTLTVQDRMALDGLLVVGRECTEELLWRIEQLSAQPSCGRVLG